MTKGPEGTVLYVDDDESNRHAFSLFFRQAGFEVKEAGTGGEALRLAAERPDLVILDVHLPDVSGFEVCRRIKQHPATTAIPVMHLSAVHISPEDRTYALEEGADAYLTKPVAPSEVVAQAKALLRTHRAEERAREAARQWQATFAAINDGVCLLDRAGRVLRCNPALEKILARPTTEIVGQSCHDLTPDADPGGASAFRRMLQTRQREVVELAMGDRWLQAVADPMFTEDGTLTGAVYVLSDATERKRLEARLRQSQKMETLGQLAGGVAHDFNNLLTAITGNISLLLAATPELHPDRELLLAVEQAAWRAADLTRQLLGFSRASAPRLQPTNLAPCLDEVVRLLRRTFDPRISLEARAAPDLWLVQADHGQINQVLMNLCVNARDAMPEGGRILLDAENVRLDESQARSAPEARPGEFVRLRVRDNGQGVPADVLPHIFEPFYTTKKGHGTGLGLATVYGIVEQHGGWIACSSEVKQGTCFDVYLPRLGGGGGGGATAPPPPPNRGTETVLLVDDDRILRTLGSTILRHHGYRVLLAGDGQEALEIYQREKQQIGLVILDLNMPVLSGRETFRQLLQIDPAVRVLLCSGHLAEEAAEIESEGALGFVAKPYGMQELADAVRKILEARSSPSVVDRAPPIRAASIEVAVAPWDFRVSGLTKAEAEELLDWLENNDYEQRDLVWEDERFVVFWQARPVRGTAAAQALWGRTLRRASSNRWPLGGPNSQQASEWGWC